MKVAPAAWPSRHLFDVRIDAVTTKQVLDAVDRAIAERRRLLITVVNAAKMVQIDRDRGLRRAVLGADLILADGMSIVWACRLLGTPLPERVTGIDLMTRILHRADRRQHRVYLLGATEEVLARVRSRIERQFSNAVIVGARNGYFTKDEEAGVAAEIVAAAPEILFVAMSSPRKEKFIAAWSETMNVPVCHGVGGAFDVFAGCVRRAPEMIQRLGLEWAYRAAQEPRRLGARYLDTNTVFMFKLAKEAIQRATRLVTGPVRKWVSPENRRKGRLA
ncbi:MAG TPA: WecB/TagA/CpsF family glycosyltransferase [Phycisphaerae bacterium]|nr:WecB/TagA/CpsF family glycosyltransferase [Phycisphaerae bacterium]